MAEVIFDSSELARKILVWLKPYLGTTERLIGFVVQQQGHDLVLEIPYEWGWSRVVRLLVNVPDKVQESLDSARKFEETLLLAGFTQESNLPGGAVLRFANYANQLNPSVEMYNAADD